MNSKFYDQKEPGHIRDFCGTSRIQRDISMRSLMRNLQDCMGIFHVHPQAASLPYLLRHTVSPWPIQDDAWLWHGPRHPSQAGALALKQPWHSGLTLEVAEKTVAIPTILRCNKAL